MITGTKVKVFKFKVTNHDAECFDHNSNVSVDNEEYIEKTLDSFLIGKSFIDMKVVAVNDKYHNNGYNNTIHLVYTIIYK